MCALRLLRAGSAPPTSDMDRSTLLSRIGVFVLQYAKVIVPRWASTTRWTFHLQASTHFHFYCIVTFSDIPKYYIWINNLIGE